MSSHESDKTIVNLNVGGVFYTTTLTTVTRHAKSSLANLLKSGKCPTDSHGNYFIDRDGGLFRYILMYLRTKELILPNDFNELDLLRAEAEFYGLGELSAILSERGKRKFDAKNAGVNTKATTCYEHVELICHTRHVEIFGDLQTMEECFNKTTFSEYAKTECTKTIEGTVNVEVKIDNRRGHYVGNEPKTTILDALGRHGFVIVASSSLADPKNPANVKQLVMLSRVRK